MFEERARSIKTGTGREGFGSVDEGAVRKFMKKFDREQVDAITGQKTVVGNNDGFVTFKEYLAGTKWTEEFEAKQLQEMEDFARTQSGSERALQVEASGEYGWGGEAT